MALYVTCIRKHHTKYFLIFFSNPSLSALTLAAACPLFSSSSLVDFLIPFFYPLVFTPMGHFLYLSLIPTPIGLFLSLSLSTSRVVDRCVSCARKSNGAPGSAVLCRGFRILVPSVARLGILTIREMAKHPRESYYCTVVHFGSDLAVNTRSAEHTYSPK